MARTVSPRRPRPPRPTTWLTAAAVVAALVAGACSGDDDDDDVATTDRPAATTAAPDPVAAAEERVATAEDGVAASTDALTAARTDFCDVAKDYVEVLDRYGRVFTDRSATVGDVRTLGADLVEPRDDVVAAAGAVQEANDAVTAAQQELVDAQAALAAAVATASSVPVSTTAPADVTPTTVVPPTSIERVQQAEDDLARAERGITDETPLVEAAVAYNSAALSLEMAWLRLLDDAGCFTDEQQAQAAEQVVAYTTALQTDLQAAGYDPGPIDGIYGPKTTAAVEQLQTDSGLKVTGWVDEATARALQDALDAAGLDQARQTVILQTILSLVGYWDGPLDGVWTDDLTAALQDFQTALGVEPTGVVDAATIAAFQQALAGVEAGTPPTTAPATETTTPATTAPASSDVAALVLAESSLGPILTSATGFTVYAFEPDAQGPPTCTGSCAGSWPPVTTDDATALTVGDGLDASLLGTVDHPDGGVQLTYGGWPLYQFVGDAAAGDVSGQGSGGIWWVIDASGQLVKS